MKNLISKISKLKYINDKPPVLLDIGASEGINSLWKKIAEFSILISFDADDRDFNVNEGSNIGFKRDISFNCIVTDKEGKEKADFFLTNSPYCSSTLEPDLVNLSNYSYCDLFNVTKEIKLNSISLNEAIKKAGVDTVDWFKTDSQGTDLRLFKSLDNNLREKILIAQFEPGIIDAYKGEDKLFDMILYMNELKFILIELTIKGPLQISGEEFKKIFPNKKVQKLAGAILKTIPGWGEITYLNSLNRKDTYSSREYILICLFLSLQSHDPLAFTYAKKGYEIFKESIFRDFMNYSTNKMKKSVYNLNGLFKSIKITSNKIFK